MKEVAMAFLLSISFIAASALPIEGVVLVRDSKRLNIDSIKVFTFETYPTKYDVSNFISGSQIDSMSVLVLYFESQKLCIGAASKVLCDTLEIHLYANPEPCKRKRDTIASFYSCRSHAEELGIYGDIFPCCTEKKFLKQEIKRMERH
jgi:hypothetical protein